jgi:phenylpropionate dioxygenase-like ring-hydroxylating dioxygenase large terminal subunit
VRNYWYVAAAAADVTSKPVAMRILDEALVLFRDAQGRAAVLQDRCSHRNVQLSLGKVKDGCLQCPYHGWEFNGGGDCVRVPSACAGDVIPSGAKVPAYPVIEQDGYIWVWIGDQDPGDKLPYRLPHTTGDGWRDCRFAVTIKNSVDNVIENFIDCPHTGYVHGGLFRTPASHRAETTVRRVEDGIVIEIDEETEADSFLGRLLVAKGDKVVHIDRFIVPSTVQVSYQFSPTRHVIGHQICTPVGPFETRVFVHVSWRLGWITPLIAPLVLRVGHMVMGQDLGILENQGDMVRRHGEHFVSTAADTANVWIRHFRQQAAAGQSPGTDSVGREKRVEFRL